MTTNLEPADARTKTSVGAAAPLPRFDGATIETRLFVVLLAAIALLYVVTLRSGHSWGDDFALYLLHARNLVEGRSYADTGYIYNSANPRHSPGAYPPGFPLLLAPVYAMFGLNLFALKLVVIASFVAAVGMLVAVARPVLSPRLVLVVGLLVGFQPYFLHFKNLLIPDFTFLLFVLLTLYLIRRLHESGEDVASKLWLAVLAGGCLYFALSLRITGVALLGAVLLYHVLTRKLPSRAITVSLLTALLLYGLQYLLLPRAPGYVAQFADLPAGQLGNAAQSVIRLGKFRTMFALTDVMWEGVAWPVTVFLMFSSAALALIGYVLRLRRLSIIECFVPAYGAMLLAFPFTTARYLVPLMPFLMYYAVVAAEFLVRRGGQIGRGAVFAVVAVVAVVYAANLARVNRSPFSDGVTNPDAEQLYEYVRTCTEPGSRLVTQRPRTMALYTRRAAMTSARRLMASNEAYLSFIQSAEIDHVVTLRRTPLEQITAGLPDVFTPTFENRRFRVYRFEPRAASSAQSLSPACRGRAGLLPATTRHVPL